MNKGHKPARKHPWSFKLSQAFAKSGKTVIEPKPKPADVQDVKQKE